MSAPEQVLSSTERADRVVSPPQERTYWPAPLSRPRRPWGSIAMFLGPALAFYVAFIIFLSEWFVKGMTAGAVKG